MRVLGLLKQRFEWARRADEKSGGDWGQNLLGRFTPFKRLFRVGVRGLTHSLVIVRSKDLSLLKKAYD